MSGKRKSNFISVGKYKQRFNDLTGQRLPLGTIYQSKGLAVHVQKNHPADMANLALIPSIVSSPDYVGTNPKEANSIELVKVLSDNILVCVKLDAANNYLYVASVYPISNAKLSNRIISGRLKKY